MPDSPTEECYSVNVSKLALLALVAAFGAVKFTAAATADDKHLDCKLSDAGGEGLVFDELHTVLNFDGDVFEGLTLPYYGTATVRAGHAAIFENEIWGFYGVVGDAKIRSENGTTYGLSIDAHEYFVTIDRYTGAMQILKSKQNANYRGDWITAYYQCGAIQKRF